ncbi:MAG: cardiolipin synthase [Porticoccaceae bacterium]
MKDVLDALSTGLIFVVPLVISAGAAVISVGAAWHGLLFKRDSRAALGWVVVCLALPVIGAIFYFMFGINRVRARAQRLRGERRRWFVDFERGFRPQQVIGEEIPDNVISDSAASGPGQVADPNCTVGIARAAATVTGRPLSENNRVSILRNGEQAFPAMLAAIADARHSIFLSTYIFENNQTGLIFVQALQAALDRGVEVRVVVDGMGAWYSRGIIGALRKAGINTRRFNAPRIALPTMALNLRNHRKILLVDNHIAFAGGMNIGDRHLLGQAENNTPTADIQFCFEGPVLTQLADVFADTWRIGGDQASNDQALPELPVQASTVNADTVKADAVKESNRPYTSACRAIADGPDDNLDKLALIFVAAMDSAQHSIRIMTPYFLPSQGMIAILQSAALRGLQVSIVLPAKNNLSYVHWATRNMLWELLSCGVKVYYQPGVFVHTKLLLIDDAYALVGSANIDPRSLRLNYELGVEIYDQAVVAELIGDFEEAVGRSAPITQQVLDERSLLERTRDAVCWLVSPYL